MKYISTIDEAPGALFLSSLSISSETTQEDKPRLSPVETSQLLFNHGIQTTGCYNRGWYCGH